MNAARTTPRFAQGDVERARSNAACAHCGLPLVARRAGDEHYCCSGCYLAHRLSHRGLDASTDRLLSRVVLSAFLAMGVMVFSLSLYSRALHDEGDGETAQALTGVFRLGAFAFSTPALLLLGAPLFDAVVALRRWLSAEALVLVGAASAWGVSAWNTFHGGGEVYYDTATMVVVLYSLGRWLDVRARERATEELRSLAPDREGPVARLSTDGESESLVGAAEIAVGDLLRVRPGEIAPVDGVIVAGRSFVDTSALSGESQPRSLGEDDLLHAGSVLVDGSLVVRATAAVGHRLRDEVERLLREAMEQRSHWVRTADRIAGALLPLVLVLAVATVVVRQRSAGWESAWLDALSVVLISCPCALGIATPLAFWTAMGAAYKRGVLVRGGDALERLAGVRRIFLDKTGTLTSGDFELETVEALEGEARDALRLAGALEVGSEHPIARSMRAAWAAREGGVALPRVANFVALPGVGVQGVVDGVEYALTRSDAHPERDDATWIELRSGARALARFGLVSSLRADAAAVVARLAALGLAPRVLTGDAEAPARALGRELGIEVDARLSPADKVARIAAAGVPCAFVGDGLNDAAALAAAQVGITAHGGVAASLSAAQINLLRPGLSGLPDVIELARRAVFAARLNLAWAFLYNAVGLYFAVTGRLSPIFAASAMVASSLFSALNSRRLILPGAPDGSLRTRPEGECALRTTASVRGAVR